MFQALCCLMRGSPQQSWPCPLYFFAWGTKVRFLKNRHDCAISLLKSFSFGLRVKSTFPQQSLTSSALSLLPLSQFLQPMPSHIDILDRPTHLCCFTSMTVPKLLHYLKHPRSLLLCSLLLLADFYSSFKASSNMFCSMKSYLSVPIPPIPNSPHTELS